MRSIRPVGRARLNGLLVLSSWSSWPRRRRRPARSRHRHSQTPRGSLPVCRNPKRPRRMLRSRAARRARRRLRGRRRRPCRRLRSLAPKGSSPDPRPRGTAAGPDSHGPRSALPALALRSVHRGGSGTEADASATPAVRQARRRRSAPLPRARQPRYRLRCPSRRRPARPPTRGRDRPGRGGAS